MVIGTRVVATSAVVAMEAAMTVVMVEAVVMTASTTEAVALAGTRGLSTTAEKAAARVVAPTAGAAVSTPSH